MDWVLLSFIVLNSAGIVALIRMLRPAVRRATAFQAVSKLSDDEVKDLLNTIAELKREHVDLTKFVYRLVHDDIPGSLKLLQERSASRHEETALILKGISEKLDELLREGRQ